MLILCTVKMAAALPVFENFDVHGEPGSWKRWLQRLKNLFVAADIEDDKRQRALLLHYGGSQLYDIYETLPDTGDDFETLSEHLTNYFEPKKNVEFEIYKFRQCKQNIGETIDQFQTRLRKLALNCEFTDRDKEIKSQIIQCCVSQRLRRKALRTSSMSLTELIAEARSLEISEIQATGIEGNNIAETSQSNVNEVSKPVNKKSNRDKHCFKCGGEYPHYKEECPARHRKCNKCRRYGHFEKMCNPRSKTHGRNSNSVHSRSTVREVDEVVSESSDEEYTFAVNGRGCNKSRPELNVKINGKVCNMLIDSGSTVNIINSEVAKRLDVKLFPCNRNLFAFNASQPLPVVGKFSAKIVYKGKFCKSDFVVVQGKGRSIIGYSSAVELGVLQFIYNVDSSVSESIYQQYPILFSGKTGKMKDTAVKLHIDDSVNPVNQTHRRVPFHHRENVAKQLDHLLSEDIIEKSTGPTPWINPVVIVPKPKQPGGIRLCVDMRQANKAISRERHIMPTLDDIIYDLNGATIFSKVDLKEGYHQLELDVNSRYITTFSTHLGLFRYKRLSFGINAAAEKFQEVISTAIGDISNTKNISDDIIVYGKNVQEHDQALHKLLKRLSDLNLTLNKKKCQFYTSSIEYYGWRFSAKGMSPDPNKIETIRNMKPPSDIKACRSLLGMTNYVSRLIPNYADLVAPICSLTRKGVKFIWGTKQQEVFEKLKAKLISSSVMAYFDPNLETELHVDAGPNGLGAILSQNNGVIAYASKTLSEVESRYSQIEREALAISWACHHFRMYLLGKHFTVVTDHLPLVSLFNNPRSKVSARIDNWILRLQVFKFNVVFSKGSSNPADFASRYVNCVDEHNFIGESTDDFIAFIVNSSIPKALSVREVRYQTQNDDVLNKVIENLCTGSWDNLDEKLKPFEMIKNELTCVNGNLVLRGNRLVIPDSLQQHVIGLAHEGHQGMVKTKMLLRDKVWFPKMDMMCENMIKTCHQCQVVTHVAAREPLKMTRIPEDPWINISVDFAEVSGQYVLIIVDDHSRYPFAECVRSTSAKAVIPKLDKVFGMFGIPKIVKSDNGPPFNGHEFKVFADQLNFSHRKISPLWPEANGEAERFVKTFKKFVRTATNWKQEMQSFLRNYRATCHCTTGVAPATALFGRELRIKLPSFENVKSNCFDKEQMLKHDIIQKEKMKMYADKNRNVKESDIAVGDKVLVQQRKSNVFSTPYSKQPLTVTHRNHSLITATNGEKNITRNSSHFKKFNEQSKFQMSPNTFESQEFVRDDNEMTTINSENQTGTEENSGSLTSLDNEFSQDVVESPVLRRSSRSVKVPQRLIENM